MIKENNNSNKNRKSGYSLVETLVYVAIFSILSVVVVRTIVVMMRSFSETVVIRDFLKTSFIMERVSREIRIAESTDPTSIFDSSPGYLKINSTDDSGNPKIVEFQLIGTDLQLKENSVVIGNLNIANIKIISLIFRQISTPQGEAIKIEMSIQNINDKSARIENFYDTVEMRGGYGI